MGMRRIIAVVFVAILVSTGSAVGQGRWNSGVVPAQVLEVAKSGARFTKICGGDPNAIWSNSASLCDADSALAAIPNGDPNGYIVNVACGVYDESVNFAGATDGTLGKDNVVLRGAGPACTYLRPSVDSYDDVQQGVINIPYTSDNIEVTGFTIWNDAANAAGVNNAQAINIADANQINTCTTSECASGIWFHDNVIVSNQLGVRIGGSGIGFLSDHGQWTFEDNTFIVGGKGIEKFGYGDLMVRNNRFLHISNYCDAADAGDDRQGVVACTGGCTTTGFNLESADNEGDAYYGGAVGIMKGAGCPVADEVFWIGQYLTSNNRVVLPIALSNAPTTSCVYTIWGVKGTGSTTNNSHGEGPARCTDKDWSLYWPNTTNVYRPTFSVWQEAVGTEVDINYRDKLRVIDNDIRMVVNDAPPEQGLTGTFDCGARQQMAGVVVKGGHNIVEISGMHMEADLNVNVQPPSAAFANGCTHTQIAGVVVSDVSALGSNGGGGSQMTPIRFSNSSVTIRNNADPEANIYGVLNNAAADNDWIPSRIDVSNVSVNLQQPLVWVKMDDGGVFTDRSQESRDRNDAAFNALPATEATDDALYIGTANQFIRSFTFDFATPGVGTAVTWEHSCPSGWCDTASETNLYFSDGTSGLTADGTVSLVPGEGANRWTPTVDPNNLERMYWLRARVTSASYTTTPTIDTVTVSTGKAYTLGQYREGVIRAMAVETPRDFITQIGTINWSGGESFVTPADIGLASFFIDSGSASALTDGRMYCVVSDVPRGTKQLSTARWVLQTSGGAPSTGSLCVYSYDGQILEAKAESIDMTVGTGPKDTSLATSTSLSPGLHWFCMGQTGAGTSPNIVGIRSDSSTDLDHPGLPAVLAGEITSGGSGTCPSTIDTATITQSSGLDIPTFYLYD